MTYRPPPRGSYVGVPPAVSGGGGSVDTTARATATANTAALAILTPKVIDAANITTDDTLKTVTFPLQSGGNEVVDIAGMFAGLTTVPETAVQTTYDNVVSALAAGNVQAAIDELAAAQATANAAIAQEATDRAAAIAPVDAKATAAQTAVALEKTRNDTQDPDIAANTAKRHEPFNLTNNAGAFAFDLAAQTANVPPVATVTHAITVNATGGTATAFPATVTDGEDVEIVPADGFEITVRNVGTLTGGKVYLDNVTAPTTVNVTVAAISASIETSTDADFTTAADLLKFSNRQTIQQHEEDNASHQSGPAQVGTIVQVADGGNAAAPTARPSGDPLQVGDAFGILLADPDGTKDLTATTTGVSEGGAVQGQSGTIKTWWVKSLGPTVWEEENPEVPPQVETENLTYGALGIPADNDTDYVDGDYVVLQDGSLHGPRAGGVFPPAAIRNIFESTRVAAANWNAADAEHDVLKSYTPKDILDQARPNRIALPVDNKPLASQFHLIAGATTLDGTDVLAGGAESYYFDLPPNTALTVPGIVTPITHAGPNNESVHLMPHPANAGEFVRINGNAEDAATTSWVFSTASTVAQDGDKIVVLPDHDITFDSTTNLESIQLAPSTGRWDDIATGTGSFIPDAGFTWGNNQSLLFSSDIITAIVDVANTNILLLSGGDSAPELDARHETLALLPVPGTVNPGAAALVYGETISNLNGHYTAHTDGVDQTVAVAWVKG